MRHAMWRAMLLALSLNSKRSILAAAVAVTSLLQLRTIKIDGMDNAAD